MEFGRDLCQSLIVDEGTWVVIDPHHRFDVWHLRSIDGLQWIFLDDPFRPVVHAVLSQDYYEPRVLPRGDGIDFWGDDLYDGAFGVIINR